MKTKEEQKTLKMGLVHTGIKKSTPCVKLIFCRIFCQRSCTSCSDTWHHGFFQIPTDLI